MTTKRTAEMTAICKAKHSALLPQVTDEGAAILTEWQAMATEDGFLLPHEWMGKLKFVEGEIKKAKKGE